MLPTVTAFVLCDNVHRDGQDKLYLLGLFNICNAPAFPAVFHNSWLYCALTDGHGEVPVTFRLTDASELDAPPVIVIEVPLRFRDPLEIVEGVVSLAVLRFPKPGLYVWQVECAGEVFHHRRLLVQQLGG